MLVGNYGITFVRFYELVRPLAARPPKLSTIFALVKANIHKNYLEWINLQTLQTLNPSRVKIAADGMVSLTGPVLIVPNMVAITIIKVALPILIGLLVVEICNRVIYTEEAPSNPENNSRKHLITAFCSVAAAGIVFLVAHRALPRAPGIYFY